MKKSLTEEQLAKAWWSRLPEPMKRHCAIRSNKIAGAALSGFDPKTLTDSQVMILYKDNKKP